MKNIEYTKMAHLYDKFYTNKNYSNEVQFIKNFIKKENCKILDAGCGSGNHAKLLADCGYIVDGFDKSREMVDIAKDKSKGSFFVDDLLDTKCQGKYDLIISFFAVFNHLKNYKEFKMALSNLKSRLNEGGIIIIDMHNPQKNGVKIEEIDNASRIMRWRKSDLLKKEFSKISYIVDGNKFETKHTFKIFEINKLTKLVTKMGFNIIGFYQNYDITKEATKKSKNIQMVISL